MDLFRLKPLEWGNHAHHWFAISAMGGYYAYENGEWELYLCGKRKACGVTDSPAAAKAACEADYKSRMMQYLEPIGDQLTKGC